MSAVGVEHPALEVQQVHGDLLADLLGLGGEARDEPLQERINGHGALPFRRG